MLGLKDKTLGMPHGTACNRLRKSVLFSLLQRLNENWCYRCGLCIESEANISIEHIEAWQGKENGKELFFDLGNIKFSHTSCNYGAAAKPNAGNRTHGTRSGYQKHGCRCIECCSWQKKRMDSYRERKPLPG